MRDIKFRGKRIDNGEWVYGYYISYGYTEKQKHYIVPSYASALYAIEVDPATVGQFTGLRDKNGAEIYEGDICAVIDVLSKNPLGFLRVLWDKCSSKIGLFAVGNIAQNLHKEYEFEVAGSIHDNPELMGTEATLNV